MIIFEGALQLNTAMHTWIQPDHGPPSPWLLHVCIEALGAWEREYQRQYQYILDKRTHRPWRLGASDRMLIFPEQLRETQELLRMFQDLPGDTAPG